MNHLADVIKPGNTYEPALTVSAKELYEVLIHFRKGATIQVEAQNSHIGGTTLQSGYAPGWGGVITLSEEDVADLQLRLLATIMLWSVQPPPTDAVPIEIPSSPMMIYFGVKASDQTVIIYCGDPFWELYIKQQTTEMKSCS